MTTTTATEHTLTRTGAAPLRFTGTRIAGVGTTICGQDRWHNLNLYQITEGPQAGAYVVEVVYHSRWDGETEHHHVDLAADGRSIGEILHRYDPTAPVVGFARPNVAMDEVRKAKHAAILADVRRRYETGVSDLLGKANIVELPEHAMRRDQAMVRYRTLLDHALADLRLTEAEASAICDVLNGTWLLEDTWRHIAMEVEDGDRLNGLGRKWGIDGRALARRLSECSLVELCAIADASERFWAAVGDGDQRSTREQLVAVGLVRE